MLKIGIISPSGTKFKIPTSLEKIIEVRIVPKLNAYCVEIVYEEEIKQKQITNYAAFIDLGVNNLAALTCNKPNFQPKLICGKALKSCNQRYNKTLAKLKSELPSNQYSSSRIQGLTLKRNCKVDYYLHTASKYIIDLLVANQISLLVVGQNKNWKKNINIGTRNNQNFVNIPHSRFIDILKYKCQLVGISCQTVIENYTSKCSFLDLEPIKKHSNYLGKRINRGLFRAKSRYIYNADIGASLNIGRKVVGEVAFSENPVERFVVNPVRIKAYKETLGHICP